MIRIKPTRRFHVSNRLALLGALTLSLTFFTGMDGAHEPVAASEPLAATVQPADENNSSDPAEQRKRFSISRLLFGHG